MQTKRILKLLAAPLALGLFYGSYYLLWRMLGLPVGDELVGRADEWFDNYGLWIIFFGALIEGVLLAGNYFPGGVIIFLGVITAGDNIPRVVGVVAIVSLALFLSYLFNYLLGRHGWYLLLVRFGLRGEMEKARKKVERHALTAVIFSYWQPNLAALTSTAAGVLRVPLTGFLWKSLIGILVWNTFWGTVVHLLHDRALRLVTSFKFIFPVLLVWILILLVRDFFQRRKEPPVEPVEKDKQFS